MDFITHKLFHPNVVNELTTLILSDQNEWEDGKKSAGSIAAKVKNNYQLDRESEISIKSSEYVSNQMLKDPLIKSFCLPRKVHGVMFTRTFAGQGYGLHVDNAYMSSGRSDLSFTLFLSPPNDYKGGSLCIQGNQSTEEVKLQQGEIVIYPSTSLHAVNEVIEGERLACVGWIQSYISSIHDREILFGLDAGARGLLAKYGPSPQLDLVFQSYNNLLRRFGD